MLAPVERFLAIEAASGIVLRLQEAMVENPLFFVSQQETFSGYSDDAQLAVWKICAETAA